MGLAVHIHVHTLFSVFLVPCVWEEEGAIWISQHVRLAAQSWSYQIFLFSVDDEALSCLAGIRFQEKKWEKGASTVRLQLRHVYTKHVIVADGQPCRLRRPPDCCVAHRDEPAHDELTEIRRNALQGDGIISVVLDAL